MRDRIPAEDGLPPGKDCTELSHSFLAVWHFQEWLLPEVLEALYSKLQRGRLLFADEMSCHYPTNPDCHAEGPHE